MRRLLHIESDDVVRRTLNQGLQLVTVGLCLTAVAIAIRALVIGPDVTLLTSLAFIPLAVVAFALTRRGSVGGAYLLSTVTACLVAASFLPESFVEPPVIHVIFLAPAIIGALFIAPWVGLALALLQSALLALRLAVEGYPVVVVLDFFLVSSLDLTAVMLPVIVAASLFRSAIVRLSALTERLDSQVAERTPELRRVMSLRESEIASVVHDIQNSMTVVRAEVDDLLDSAAAAGVDREGLRAAERRLGGAVGSVGDLVEDLRTAVQLDNAALRISHEPVNLELLARRVADQLSTPAAQAGCQLRVSTERAPLVAGDERKLERVLNNLVGNAVKYSRQLPPEERQVAVRVRPAGAGVEIMITDRGPGLSPEALALVGQPFVRLTSARGTEGMGLGVYISRGIVELHGGLMSFTSPGEAGGTTVTIWLPPGEPRV